jgi:hypothetical protein
MCPRRTSGESKRPFEGCGGTEPMTRVRIASHPTSRAVPRLLAHRRGRALSIAGGSR